MNYHTSNAYFVAGKPNPSWAATTCRIRWDRLCSFHSWNLHRHAHNKHTLRIRSTMHRWVLTKSLPKPWLPFWSFSRAPRRLITHKIIDRPGAIVHNSLLPISVYLVNPKIATRVKIIQHVYWLRPSSDPHYAALCTCLICRCLFVYAEVLSSCIFTTICWCLLGSESKCRHRAHSQRGRATTQKCARGDSCMCTVILRAYVWVHWHSQSTVSHHTQPPY